MVISIEPIKLLVKKGGGASFRSQKKIRVARNASCVVRDKSTSFVKELAQACRLFLLGNKRKTVGVATLIYVIEHGRKNWGLNTDLLEAVALRTKQSSLSRAGVVRLFKENSGSEFRMSAQAKDFLVVVVEMYVMNLGKIAGRYTEAAKRTTIKIKDISSALESLQDNR